MTSGTYSLGAPPPHGRQSRLTKTIGQSMNVIDATVKAEVVSESSP